MGHFRDPALVLWTICMLLLVNYSHTFRVRRRGCGDHGTEVAGACNCVSGWSGEHCDVHACYNGGTYDKHHHNCHCLNGFTGDFCETGSVVQPIVCQNGGTLQHHKCHCLSTYTGERCEISTPSLLCTLSTCKNGGHCFHDNVQFYCACRLGFTGTTCTDHISTQQPATGTTDLCVGVSCQHGGHCYHDNKQYFCRCPDGYTGTHCETQIISTTVCSSSPCKNGGHCFGDDNDFLCQCPQQYTGKTCEAIAATTGTPVDFCAFKPCLHGLCLSMQSDFFCYCDQGYKGRTCAEASLSCATNPCINGGHCFDDEHTYVCICPAGYSGKNCEIDLSLLPSTAAPAVHTTNSVATTGQNYLICDDVALILALNNGRISHNEARTCPSGTNKMSDAIVLKHCNGKNVTSWTPGVQVSRNCKTLPKYTAIAQFHNGVATAKTGVFLVCKGGDSFEYFTQTCDDDFKLNVMTWPESDTFYSIIQ